MTFAFQGFANGQPAKWYGCAISGQQNYPGCLPKFDPNNMRTNPSGNPYNRAYPSSYIAPYDADARVTEGFSEKYGGQNPTGLMYIYIDKNSGASGSFRACPFCASHIAALTYENPGVTVCTKDRSGEQWMYFAGMRILL